MSRDILHIFERLRTGTVPQRSLDTFAVGIEKARGELHRQLDLVASGEGSFKFIRGGYGCGKTFVSNLAICDAQSRSFATSFFVVSENDFQLQRFDDLYRKVMSELSTPYCEGQALADILDRWIGRVEEALVSSGYDEDAPDFGSQVQRKLKEELEVGVGVGQGRVPEDMLRVVSTYFELKEQQRHREAAALLSWLSGSPNIDQSIKKLAKVKGDIQGQDAMSYLRGILAIIKRAGYKGLLVVIDEVETIRNATRKDTRAKALNAIRQIIDDSPNFPGLLWIFTGTPEFYDDHRGVKGLQPLHDRIHLKTQDGFSSLKQPQLELKPFNADRLFQVAQILRRIFPTTERARLEEVLTDDYIRQLVSEVTGKFHGDVGVVPRQFLRTFVHVLDLIDENEDFRPGLTAAKEPTELTPVEQALLSGNKLYESAPEDEEGYELMTF